MNVHINGGTAVLIDDEDYDKIKESSWLFSGRYAYRQVWNKGKGKTEYMHRIIMGNPKNLEIDHINGNGIDNRKSNLRFATHKQNMANQKSCKTATSQFKGVCWVKRDKKWEASIQTDNRTKHLGYYENEADAAKAYDKEAIKLFGSFARLNFTNEMEVL